MVSKEAKENDCLEECVPRRGALAVGSLPDMCGLKWGTGSLSFHSMAPKVSVLHSDGKDPGFPVRERVSLAS